MPRSRTLNLNMKKYGHGNFKYPLDKMKIEEDDTCRLYLDKDETLVYIVYECPALASIRPWGSMSWPNAANYYRLLDKKEGR